MVKLHMAGTWGDPDGVILGLATSNNRKEWALALKTLAARVVVVDSSGKPVPKAKHNITSSAASIRSCSIWYLCARTIALVY
jgi:hypothetical protein